MEKLMTLDEVAQYLNLDRELVRMLVKEGIVPAYRIAGSFLRFDRDELEKRKDSILHTIQHYSQSHLNHDKGIESHPVRDRMLDFFYFNDFYILSIIIVIALLCLIFLF